MYIANACVGEIRVLVLVLVLELIFHRMVTTVLYLKMTASKSVIFTTPQSKDSMGKEKTYSD